MVHSTKNTAVAFVTLEFFFRSDGMINSSLTGGDNLNKIMYD